MRYLPTLALCLHGFQIYAFIFFPFSWSAVRSQIVTLSLRRSWVDKEPWPQRARSGSSIRRLLCSESAHLACRTLARNPSSGLPDPSACHLGHTYPFRELSPGLCSSASDPRAIWTGTVQIRPMDVMAETSAQPRGGTRARIWLNMTKRTLVPYQQFFLPINMIYVFI